MKILLVEPFYGASHKAWCDGLKKYSKHSVTVLGLPDRYWKWRMHGAAITLAQRTNELNEDFDLIIVSDFIDLPLYKSLLLGSDIPIAVYFHENQFAYPWSDTDQDVGLKRDVHYQFINYKTGLCADKLLFNSKYNMQSYLDGCLDMLKVFPDFQNINTVDIIKAKSEVLNLGIDLDFFDTREKNYQNEKPVIVWNHRHEYDKNPDEFFQCLFRLKEERIPFELIVLGECFKKSPPIFSKAKEVLKDEIIHFGKVIDYGAYVDLLYKSDILLITSKQDFFGISIVEATYANCYPLLPKRLAYPELIDSKIVFYDDAYSSLKDVILSGKYKESYKSFVEKFKFSKIIKYYDDAFKLISTKVE